MQRLRLHHFILLAGIAFAVCPLQARPGIESPGFTTPDGDVDVVGDVDGTHPAPQNILQDTIWIASWSFDTGAPCDDSGWQKVDNHVLYDGVIHWHVEDAYGGTGGIVGNAGSVGYHGDVCCASADGYDNDWYQAIRITYVADGLTPGQGGILEGLAFDYLLDSEQGFDFMQVENDSACSSFDRVTACRENRPFEDCVSAAVFRELEFQDTGLRLDGAVPSTDPEWNGGLTDFGAATHCLYIAFFSDRGFSPCDGNHSPSLGDGLVVDNIMVIDASGTRTEDFTDGSLDIGSFVNIHNSQPFGQWARVYPGITDNDFCTENRTCAWLWTDHTTPTIANDPSMAFAPGSFVIKNWLDDAIISPWVSLAGVTDASGTVLQFRRFGGNFFAASQIVQGHATRGRRSGELCAPPWDVDQFHSLDSFQWIDLQEDLSSSFGPLETEIQVRFRTSDWQWVQGGDPSPFTIPGPGPFLDDIRIGRIVLHGPVLSEGIDARTQAQDCFPTEIHPDVGARTGEHFRPTTDRFGSCAFSMGNDLSRSTGPNLVTGDSIVIQVADARSAGGITSVEWYGAIVAGPHAGKAPPPWSVGSNGFFAVPPDTVRIQGSILEGYYFVDLDDFYFRGGDALRYVWLASDALGGTTSNPVGLDGVPVSIEAAQEATGGLLQVSFLPAISWDPAYVARIAADPHGKLDPTPAELAGSNQEHCILYVNHHNSRRRSGDVNRSSFMYTLDRLGYRDGYDVYDHTGMGNTNNHLGGRATVEQAQGYNLIVYDAGNRSPGGVIVPDGSDFDSQKVDQVSWFRSWMAQANLGEAGWVTLWIIGSNALEERPTSQLYATDMGAVLTAPDLATNRNPDVQGVSSFTFQVGGGTPTVDFTDVQYSAREGCTVTREYDALDFAGTAVVTHIYRNPASPSFTDGAIVMNANPASWNTILQSHPWSAILDRNGTPVSPPPEVEFLGSILDNLLPSGCVRDLDPTDANPQVEIDVPLRTVLHSNVPNPFNPMTTIRFDLARAGHVRLRLYDVAGRLVRTLVDAEMPAGRDKRVVWNGLDEAGESVSGGVYFLRLEAGGDEQVRKLVLLR